MVGIFCGKYELCYVGTRFALTHIDVFIHAFETQNNRVAYVADNCKDNTRNVR